MSIILLDGATGTQLQGAGLKPGEPPYLLNMRKPEKVAAVHRAYEDAGSHIVFSNTFSVSALSLRKTGYTVRDIVTRGVEIAKGAVVNAKVALDIGPLGYDIEDPDDMSEEPGVRQISEDSARSMFAEIIKYGTESGADIIDFETMYDLRELRLALEAAKDVSKLPIFATMTFERDGVTFMGATVAEFAALAEEMNLSAIGLNCSYGPDEIFPVFSQFKELTKLPLVAKPNAGLPNETGIYDMSPEEFAESMKPFIDGGASIIGGCCGTTPAFIAALRQVID